MDAFGGRGLLGLAWRSRRPPHPADDLDPVVFALQLYCGLLADFLVPVRVPRAAWLRHGCRVAGRRSPCDGKLAYTLARLYERGTAGVVGHRVFAVERRLWAALHLDRLARPALAWHPAGADGGLCALFRQRAAGMGREPPAATRRKSRSADAALQHF